MLVGTCLWGPGCCCWKPWQSSRPTSPLLLLESPYSPCTRLCCALLSLLRGALCIFSFLMLGATWTSRPTTILFDFPFCLVDNSFRLLHISKLYWEEKSSNSCNCSCWTKTVAIIHWSFKPQTFLEATELLHFLTLPGLPFCSSLHLSPTDVPQICRTCPGAGGLNDLYSFHRQKCYEVKAPWEEIGCGNKKY